MPNTQSATPPEAHRLTKGRALDLLRQMWEIRMFEDGVYNGHLLDEHHDFVGQR